MPRSSRQIPQPTVDLVSKDMRLESVEREEVALAVSDRRRHVVHRRCYIALPATGSYLENTTSHTSPATEPAPPSARAALRVHAVAPCHAFGLLKAPGKEKSRRQVTDWVSLTSRLVG